MKFSDLYVALGFKDDKFKRGIKGAQSKTKQFSNQIKKLGGIIAAAFAVRKLVDFGKELFALGGKAAGVRAAFEKLDEPTLLANLQKATRGTIDNITLMQKAVQAKNFKIPLSQLATYFEFATKRAIETGESVDYMVESLITGVGRKSVLVMDNLGISAVELQKEVKKVGDFGLAAGNIIQRELGSMGKVASTAQTALEQLNASWTNFKTNLGESLAPVLIPAFESLTRKVKLFIIAIENNAIGDMIANTERWQRAVAKFDFKELTKGASLEELNDQLVAHTIALQKAIDGGDIAFQNSTKWRIDLIGKQILALQQLTEEVETVGRAQEKLSMMTSLDAGQVSMGDIDPLRKHREKPRSQLDFPQTIEEREDPFEFLSSEELKDKTEALEELGSVMQAVDGIVYDFSNQVVKSLDLAATGFEGFMSNLAETIMKLISMLLANSLANAIAGATNSGTATGPLAVISTPVFIATAITGVLAAFAAIPSFATGGFVPGNSFYGDNQLIRANSGELILNGQQQKNLFDMINSGGNNNGYPKEIMVRASGSDLIGVISNENKLRNN